jgi:hypothetical protein
MTRKVLGRGLGALLSAEGTATATEDAGEIPIDLIDPSPLQPRSVFDDAKLDELARSINANGVVQPFFYDGAEIDSNSSRANVAGEPRNSQASQKCRQ